MDAEEFFQSLRKDIQDTTEVLKVAIAFNEELIQKVQYAQEVANSAIATAQKYQTQARVYFWGCILMALVNGTLMGILGRYWLIESAPKIELPERYVPYIQQIG